MLVEVHLVSKLRGCDLSNSILQNMLIRLPNPIKLSASIEFVLNSLRTYRQLHGKYPELGFLLGLCAASFALQEYSVHSYL